MCNIDIEKNYELFKSYLTTFIKRDGIDKFIEWLDNSDAKVAPASTKYHLSCEGGGVQHALNVFNRLISLIQLEYGDNECPYSKETIALVALCHDVSKFNFYDIKYRNIKDDETNEWIQQPYYSVLDASNRFIFGNHAENSLYILRTFFKLSYEEELAILHHMGCFDTSETTAPARNMMEAYKKSKLAILLHTADMFATCIDEIEADIINE